MSKTQIQNTGNKPQTDQSGNITNIGIQRTLPPGVVCDVAFGHLSVEVGALKWLTYDGVNYLEDYGKGPKIQDLYANIKFWGEDPTAKGLYLKFQNGLKQRKETAAFRYKYVVNCPEPSLERYLDDMGALVIDFYSVQEGLTIGTSKIIVKLFLKRAKSATDTSPLLELKGTFPITLTGNNDAKIGEFAFSMISSFQNKVAPISSNQYNNLNQNREMIDLNDDTFESGEQQTQQNQLSQPTQNQRLHEQMNVDQRVPSSLQTKKPAHDKYNKDNFNQMQELQQERPTRDRPLNNKNYQNNQNSNNQYNTNRAPDFGNRKQISIDENDDTFQSNEQLSHILARGERLKKQMADAMDPSTSVWEQIHGIHAVPKTYVPPFQKDEFEQMRKMEEEDESPETIMQKMYEFEVDEQAMKDPNQESLIKINPNRAVLPQNRAHINLDQEQNLELAPDSEVNKRQIKDMKYIRVKVKQLRVENEDLLHRLIDKGFSLEVVVPLPDIYQKKISDQFIRLNNYDVLSFNEFAFNSLSLYNFRIDEDTLVKYVTSQMKFIITDCNVEGKISMNKLIMAHDFKLESTVDLLQTVVSAHKVQQQQNKKKAANNMLQNDATESYQRHVGTICIEVNLQSGDSEDEMRRNYQIKMQKIEEEKAKHEAEKHEMIKKKMQFVMEQAPIFGQLFLHIHKLGRNDNIGERTTEQIKNAEESAKIFESSLNNREGKDEQLSQPDVHTGKDPQKNQQLITPSRNLFIQFKAFPNLEKLRTNTIWQQNDDSVFNYRSQFPILMSPETLDKMEKFIFVLELWDQVSPSVEEFLGLVKIPLAPICYSMKTTDQEVYSLNFMADQFCMYPMIISDGYLPIYSPKLGQNIGHLKVALAMGSPVQVNRLIQKEQEEERRAQLDKEQKQIWEAQCQKELELKAARKLKKEKKRQLEEERITREKEKQEKEDGRLNIANGQFIKPQDRNQLSGSPNKMMQQLLRQSINSQLADGGRPDYDQRNQSMLNCMRKLFEEARAQSIDELNGEKIFKDEVKNFDGTVQKDTIIYTLLENQCFSLTRIELAQIVNLMLDINRDDQGRVDIDELHFSYRSYIKYYELIEQRIIDLLEKFKISIVKKLEIQGIVLELCAEIEEKSNDSKMSIIELREIIEDRHGIQIRDALYDQFMLFFDLDRDQNVYITSLCEYLKTLSSQKINFYKVNTNIIVHKISEYIKNSIETQPECLSLLEEEFKQEIWKNRKPIAENIMEGGSTVEIENPPEELSQLIPADLLIKEKINAKLFQYKLKRLGIALSLWEVFTLFEALNTKNAKMYFEPQRYHHIMFENFYKFIRNEEYTRGAVEATEELKINIAKDKQTEMRKQGLKSGSEAQSRKKKSSKVKKEGKNNKVQDHKDQNLSSESSERASSQQNEEESDEEDEDLPYKQVKHLFEIRVKELKNIPVLNKFICQSQTNKENDLNSASQLNMDAKSQKIARAQANKYIQNVAVKYSFPLDEDEILESDYLQLNKEALDQQGVYNYTVSMDTVHTYIIGKEDDIKKVLEICQSRGGNQNASGMGDQYDDGNMTNSNGARKEELFNMSIALYEDNREYVIGNSHLPIEDLVDTISQFEQKNGTYDKKIKKSSLIRTLFLYGTTYSQRENCIIGKLQIELFYSQEKLFLSKKEAKLYKQEQEQIKGTEQLQPNPYSCFMHRETYINRKIPLNAKLSVLIDRVSNLKESIENIEHFAKIQHSALGVGFLDNQDGFNTEISQKLSSSTFVHNRRDMQHLDRRRVLKHILKNGLNLIVRCSMFEEDQELVKKFNLTDESQEEFNNRLDAHLLQNYSKYQTRMLYNSLNPVFSEVFDMNLQMDTKIFEYLKNKRAIFEIRHYIVQTQKQKVNKLRESQSRIYGDDINSRKFDDDEESQNTIEDAEVIDQCDYIVLGYARVPLLQLITKNNGVDGDFSIFDEFKQKMGSLKLRITLNHHNSQRPLYSTSNKVPNQIQTSNISTNNWKKTLIDKSIQLCSQIKIGTITRSQMKQQKLILGLDFIELILKQRKDLVRHINGQVQRFYIKFSFFNQNYQTKFIGGDDSFSLSPLNILLQKIKLQKIDIGKTTLIELDLMDQQQIEQAFGKPLEIQLWHKIESLKSYEKPIKEEMIGQFYIELNELTKITNRRLKDQTAQEGQPGKVQVYEGYFSLHDSKRDTLSSDRLGMRLFLFNKDDTNMTLTLDELNQIFNQYRPKIEECIQKKLDLSGKGYTDSDDLIQVVKDEIPDEYLSQKLIWFIKSSLEFKSVDKVYYSPLFGLPPPFFKYSKKFDQLEIICKFFEEFEALDSHDNGFIPVNLFRNSLEGELKIKTKIIDDFVNSLRDINIENSNAQSRTATVKEIQSLDVNLITNSLKTSHIDYIILLRKLSQFMEQNQGYNDAKSLVHSRVMDRVKEHESSQEVLIYFEVDNAMRLKNPINSLETPNSYVYMKPTFQYKESGQFVQTNQIKSNSYPNWNFKSQNFTMPINQSNREWLEAGGNLEFEVFHKALGASNNLNVLESSHLIGVAFVSLKPLIEGNGKTRLTGLFDVVSKQNIFSQSVQTNSSIKQQMEVSFGKVKICVTTNLNIKKITEGDNCQVQNSFDGEGKSLRSSAQNFQQIGPTFGKNVSFSQEYHNNPYPSTKQSKVPGEMDKATKDLGLEHLEIGPLSSQNFMLLDNSVRAYHQSLQSVTEKQLDELHRTNLNDLDSLTKKLKDSLIILDVSESAENQYSASRELNLQKTFAADFGHATFKTDIQQSEIGQQLQEFRHQRLTSVQNPFASIGTLGGEFAVGELAMDNKEEDEDLLRIDEEESQLTYQDLAIGKKDLEQKKPVNMANSSGSPKSGKFGQQSDASASQGNKDQEFANAFELGDRVNMTDEFDEEEMKRIEKILKKK